MSLTYESLALQPATVITAVERIVAAGQPLGIREYVLGRIQALNSSEPSAPENP